MRWRVFCAATEPLPDGRGRFCDWPGGYRTAATEEAATAKPCPRCGRHVVAVAATERGDQRWR